MQARKRAKPVKFGKPAEAKPKPKEKPETPPPPVETTPKEQPVIPEPPKKEEVEVKAPQSGVFEEPKKPDEGPFVPEKPVDLSKEDTFETLGVPAPEPKDEPKKEEILSSTPLPEVSTSKNIVSDTTSPAEEELLSAQPVSSAFSTSPDVPVEGKKGNFLYFIIVALVSFIIGLASMAGIDYFIKNKGENNSKVPSVASAPVNNNKSKENTTEEKKTATPAPTVSKTVTKTLNIQVLNGSGITGEASKLKEALVSAGFKVPTIGNADRSDYTKTQIAAKKTVSSANLTKLKDLLKKTYVLAPVSTLPSTSSDSADIIITIGADTP